MPDFDIKKWLIDQAENFGYMDQLMTSGNGLKKSGMTSSASSKLGKGSGKGSSKASISSGSECGLKAEVKKEPI